MNYNVINLWSARSVVEMVWAMQKDVPYTKDLWKGPIEVPRAFEGQLRVASPATTLIVDEITAVLKDSCEGGLLRMLLEGEQCQWIYAITINSDGSSEEIATKPNFEPYTLHPEAPDGDGFWAALARQNQWAKEELDLLTSIEKRSRLQIGSSLDFVPGTATKH